MHAHTQIFLFCVNTQQIHTLTYTHTHTHTHTHTCKPSLFFEVLDFIGGKVLDLYILHCCHKSAGISNIAECHNGREKCIYFQRWHHLVVLDSLLSVLATAVCSDLTYEVDWE